MREVSKAQQTVGMSHTKHNFELHTVSEEASGTQDHFNNYNNIIFLLHIPRIKQWDDLSWEKGEED